MSMNPPEARRVPIKRDVMEQLRAHAPLADVLDAGYGNNYGEDYGEEISNVVRPKNHLDKADEPTEPVLILVGVIGETQTQRNVATVDAEYLVQILILRSDGHRRGSSSLWIDWMHDAIAEALTHFSAGGSIPQGQSGGVEEQWSEQRNRWMSDITFTYHA